MIRVYMGYDPRDTLAFEVAAHSLKTHASDRVTIVPLKDWELRHRGIYFRTCWINERGQRFDGNDGVPCSTEFSYLRFLIPFLEDFKDDWVVWTDPDVLWRADINELLSLIDRDKAIMCVKHDHRPDEELKMTGTIQRRYERKNWSSVMAINPARNRHLTKFCVNRSSKDWLHAFSWLQNEEIGDLGPEWNWLAGWSSPDIDPKLVHFTRGSPDMPGHADEPYADEWWETLELAHPRLAAFPY